MKAWHFVRANKQLGYGDNRIVQVGQTYRYEGKEPIELCKRGMHGSVKIMDALKYAEGNIICRVELSGDIIHGDDKVVATERKVLAMIDGEKVLRKFACMCALDVIHLWDAHEIVVRYLKTQDESIRHEARAAAWYSARATSAWAALATSAAWDSALASASAARDSALASASAARTARTARDAWAREAWEAWAKLNARLTRMVNKAIKGGR